MTDNKLDSAKETAKKVYHGIRETLVQDDNPNSPHLLLQRMNQNMLGDAPEQVVEKARETTTEAPTVKPSDKKRKQLFSPESFEKLIWGDEK